MAEGFFVRGIKWTLGLAAMSAVPAPAAAEPVILAPSTPWTLDYATDHCRLARTFGEGEQKVALLIDRAGPMPVYRFTVAGAPMRSRDRASWPLRLRPDGDPMEQGAFKGELGDFGDAVIFSAVPWPEAVKTPDFDPDFVEIGGLRGDDVRLATGSFEAPLAEMEKCIDSLVRDWGLDPDEQRSLSQNPVPLGDIAEWIRSSDYPRMASFLGRQGSLAVRMSVLPDGTPSDCAVQLRTTPADFDAAACDALMKRAQFTPGLDAAGNPVAALWEARVAFVMDRGTRMRSKRGVGEN